MVPEPFEARAELAPSKSGSTNFQKPESAELNLGRVALEDYCRKRGLTDIFANAAFVPTTRFEPPRLEGEI